jgi:hypothetical protein
MRDPAGSYLAFGPIGEIERQAHAVFTAIIQFPAMA